MKISYDGALARVQLENSDPQDIITKLKYLLQWTDQRIVKQNMFVKTSFGYKDPCRSCFNTISNTFPTGLLQKVITYVESLGIKYKLERDQEFQVRRPLELDNFELPDWAWDHQVKAIETALSFERCMISSPTGSGKSKIIAWITKYFPEEIILITTPSIALKNAMANELRKQYDEEIGEIGGGKAKIARITVGVMNSLAKHSTSKYEEYLKSVDVLLGDECHTGTCEMYGQVSSRCKNTSFRLGISATAYSEVGAELVLEGVFGPLVLEIPEMEMVSNGVIHKPKVYFVEIPMPKNERKYPPNRYPDQRDIYQEWICNNSYRNELIVEIVQKYLEVDQEGQVLVLVDEIENHGIPLLGMFHSSGLEIPFLHGGLPKKERDKTLNSFYQGEPRAILASRVMNTGIDVPSIALTINAGAGSGTIKLTQKTGRCVRVDPTGKKKQAIQVDFWDDEPFYYARQAGKRFKHLNKLYPNSCKVCSPSELFETFYELSKV
jgi:superfamily II DNA or RNA helicase